MAIGAGPGRWPFADVVLSGQTDLGQSMRSNPSGIGATLAALSGINNVSGPGMLDFESCFSLEKLVLLSMSSLVLINDSSILNKVKTVSPSEPAVTMCRVVVLARVKVT